MKIELDQSQIEHATSAAVTTAVKDALNSYKTVGIIQESIRSSIMDSTIENAIIQALDQLDFSTITEQLTKEIITEIREGITMMIEETMINMVFKLRGYKDYMRDDEINKAKIEIRMEYRNRILGQS